MKKIIKYFPLNKGIWEEEIKTLIKPIAIYLGIAIVIVTISNITDGIPVIRNLTFNISNIYGYYFLIGIGLACYQYFTQKNYADVEFITLKDITALWGSVKGKILFGGLIGLMCLIPHKGIPQAVPVQNQIVKEDEEFEKIEEKAEDAEVKKEVLKNEESFEEVSAPEIVEKAVVEEGASKDLLEFYECVKGVWKNSEIIFSFFRNAENYYFVNSEMGFDIGIPVYDIADLTKSENKISALLVDEENNEYFVCIEEENGEKNLKITEKETNSVYELSYDTCTNYDEIFEKTNYKVPFIMRYYSEGPISGEIASVNINSNKYALLDVVPELEGDELLIQDNTGDWVDIWGIVDGVVRPLGGGFCFMEKDGYNPETKTFYSFYYGGTSGGSTYREHKYSEEIGELIAYDIGWDEPKYEPIRYLPMNEADLEAFLEEEKRKELEIQEQERIRNFTVDESMVVTTPLEEYEGIYYKEYGNIYISKVSDDILTVNHTEESNYSIFGILARQKEGYPEGTAVYGGTVTSNGRYGHTGSFEGRIFIVLLPDGDIFIKCFDGYPMYQEGFFSKEEGKY